VPTHGTQLTSKSRNSHDLITTPQVAVTAGRFHIGQLLGSGANEPFATILANQPD
jgi:hypothetical protein